MGKRTKKDPVERPKMCLRLAAIRGVLDFKGWQMAKILKVTGQGTYGKYETRTRPTREVVGQVNRRFGVPANALLDTGDVSDEEFDRILEDLKARKPRIHQIFNALMTDSANTPGAEKASSTNDKGEVIVGQETLDKILHILERIAAKIDEPAKPTQEPSKKKGFPTGGG